MSRHVVILAAITDFFIGTHNSGDYVTFGHHYKPSLFNITFFTTLLDVTFGVTFKHHF